MKQIILFPTILFCLCTGCGHQDEKMSFQPVNGTYVSTFSTDLFCETDSLFIHRLSSPGRYRVLRKTALSLVKRFGFQKRAYRQDEWVASFDSVSWALRSPKQYPSLFLEDQAVTLLGNVFKKVN